MLGALGVPDPERLAGPVVALIAGLQLRRLATGSTGKTSIADGGYDARSMSPADSANVARADMSKPNAARMYDYHLGGAHNFEPDRVLADQVARVAPWVKDVARINRAWLQPGAERPDVPRHPPVPRPRLRHPDGRQRARDRPARRPATRVVYVDYEPVAVRHSTSCCKDNENATIVWADVRDPQRGARARRGDRG